MLSGRYAVPVCILLIFALVPTVIHNYIGAVADDHLATAAIAEIIGDYTSEPTDRRAAWVEETFETSDWFERNYIAPGGNKVLFFAAETYNLKRLYHHPEIGILRGVDLVYEGNTTLGRSTRFPAFILRARSGTGAAAYALLYDGKFVENPVTLQLKSSFELLVSPRKPMYLFFIYDSELPGNAEFSTSNTALLLERAITEFRNQH